MRYRVLKNEIVEQNSLEEIRGLRLRNSTDGIVYLDVELPSGGRTAILWFDAEGNVNIARSNLLRAGLILAERA